MKVLIVDDEKLIRDVIKEYCFENKYDVLEAENGIEAIDKSVEADIIIMDIMMPKMDGFTAYKKIKEKRNIPTIMLSARGEEYDILAGFDLGIDDYMTKPFSPKELMARINAVIKRYKGEDNVFIYGWKIKNIALLKEKNVDSVVVGSYLYNALDLNKAVESLKNAEVVKEDKPAKTTKEKAKATKKPATKTKKAKA